MQDLSHLDLLDPTCETVTFPLPLIFRSPTFPCSTGMSCHVLSRCTSAFVDGEAPSANSLFRQKPWPSFGLRAIITVGYPTMGFDKMSALLCASATSGESAIDQESTSRQYQARPPEQRSVGNQMLELVLAELAAAEKQLKLTTDVVTNKQSRTEISPWLEKTRSPRYLQGHKLSQVALLPRLPFAGAEPLLDVFVASLNRPVDQARDSLSQQRVSVFD